MFRRLISCIFCVFLCFYSLNPAQAVENKARLSRYQNQQFKNEIDKLIDLYGARANVGIEVVSLKTGHCLYQKNADTLFVPASCLKMFTAAAALDILGPHFQFVTSIYTDGKIEAKTLKGNLYLKGSGDPELSSKDLEEFVFSLKLLGIEKIEGDIYVDNSAFDGVSQGPGWMWDDAPEYWNSPMDALTCDHSCMKVWVCPSEECNQLAKVYVSTKTPYVKIENQIKTNDAIESDVKVKREKILEKNKISLNGSIAKGSEPLSFEVSLASPHLYAGHVFLSFLDKHSIYVLGNLKDGRAPSIVHPLAEHASRPLSLILQKMMKDSDNLYADCLFKKVAQEKHKACGTWALASKTVREFLKSKMGLSTSEMVVLDGSGVSRYNLVSPRHFTELLARIKTEYPYSAEFISSLPISGIDGSLKKAMDDQELTSKVRAKSGSMRGIRTLCGYVTTKEGEDLIFTVMMNGFIEPRPKEGRLENELCKFLVGYSNQ